MHKLFRLSDNNTTVSTEVVAGITTFFAMAYIIVVNPSVLSTAGMPWGAVFLATLIAAIIGTLIMGLVANVPYGVAPGVGLDAFFTFTVVKGLGFTWQQTMCMVFLCGLINILVTATKLRKMIIQAIPPLLQHAIGGGIGVFIAYVGLLNVGIIKFTPDKTSAAGANPGLTTFNTPGVILFVIGLLLTVFLLIFKFKGHLAFINKGAFVIAIIAVTLLGIPMGVTSMAKSVDLGQAWSQLPQTFLAIFSPEGFPALFSDPAKLPVVLVTIFAFSLSDTFDTIGTFVGTGRRSDGAWLQLQDGQGLVRRCHRNLHRRSLRHLQYHHIRRVCSRHRSRWPNRTDLGGHRRLLCTQRRLRSADFGCAIGGHRTRSGHCGLHDDELLRRD